MKVAIVWPEVADMARYRELRKEFPPFGALYLGAILEERGVEVHLFKLTPDNLIFDFSEFDAIAFSISASATFNMFLECRQKSVFRDDALLMAGGVHANLLPVQTFLDLEPHVVGIGEGEETILEILARRTQRDFSDVQGVCYRDGDRIVRTAPRQISRDISNFPFPARHLLPEEDFIMTDRMSNKRLRMTHIVPGRGCPFPCRYCASAQTKAQYRSGENIRAELIHLKERYGIEGFAVVGNDFILNKNNVADICQRIQDLDLQWATLTRVDRVDPQTLRLMVGAGCYELEYGVESGSQRILDAMDKGVTVAQIRTALRDAYEAGIKNKVFLVHGYPGEDQESTEETMRLLDEVGQWIERVSLFRFVPLPGTYAYNHARELGIHGTDQDPGWDGDWGKYHIHHNHHNWWGTPRDFENLTRRFWDLAAYVESRWPSRFLATDLPPDRWQQQSRQFAHSRIVVAGPARAARPLGHFS